jgi:integrase
MDELAQVWRASGDDPHGAIVKLLILTACRRTEIGALRVEEIEGDLIKLPAERIKTWQPFNVPLSPLAQSILAPFSGTPFVFSGVKPFVTWSRHKAALDAVLGPDFKSWVVHDLRRSAATNMAEIGIQPHVIEAVLNHTGGHKAGIAGVYNRAAYDREKRQALDLWADYVMAAVEGRTITNVVPMRA